MLHYSNGKVKFQGQLTEASEIEIMVKPVVVYGSEEWPMTEMGMKKTEYMGEENMKEDIWTSGRTRYDEDKN